MTYASAVDSTASANSALSAAGEGFGSVHGWSMSAANGVSTTVAALSWPAATGAAG